jgi:AAA15 family ATPase/GTPase
MLTRVFIDNYKCFVNFSFTTLAKQLVLGVNGAGKSAFLDALLAIRDFTRPGEKVDRILNQDTRTRWQTLTQQSFELEVSGNGGNYTILSGSRSRTANPSLA